MTLSANNLPVDLGEALLDSLRIVATTLQQRKVVFAVMRGLAVTMRGWLRTTKDIDILMGPTQVQLDRLLEDLVESSFSIDIPQAITRWNHEGLMPVASSSGIRVDFLRSILPVFESILK